MISLKRRYLLIIVVIILICSFSLSAFAVNDIDALNAELDEQQANQTYTTGKIWLEFFKLVLVLALIVGAAWSIIRIFGKQMTNKMQGTWIHVVDEVTLGQNRGIVLCEVGEKLYAIGVTDHNINLLFEVVNPKLLEEISFTQAEELPNDLDFNKVKDMIMDKLKINQSSISNSSRSDFQTLMDEQFQRLEKITDNNISRNETEKEVMK